MPSDADDLLNRLDKLATLFARAGTEGERDAAGAAIERLRERLDADDTIIELKFSLPDTWSVRLFVAICRKNGVHPYRYPRQRRTTVMARGTKDMLDNVIWAEFTELASELGKYFDETVEHLIANAMKSDGDDTTLAEPTRLGRGAAGLPGES